MDREAFVQAQRFRCRAHWKFWNFRDPAVPAAPQNNVLAHLPVLEILMVISVCRHFLKFKQPFIY